MDREVVPNHLTIVEREVVGRHPFSVRGQHALSSPHCSTSPPALLPYSHICRQPRQPSPTTYKPVRISRIPPTPLRRVSRTFEDLRGPSRTFAVLRSPSIPLEILRDPLRRFDPSSIPFETVRSLVDPLRRSSRVYRAFAEA